MNVKIVVHEAEEGGFWAEVPALPGCASQGETMDDLLANMREAIQAWLDTEPLDDANEPLATGGRAYLVKGLSDISFLPPG
jgi:predicted RNase H-like HicB family nuclease